MESERRASGRCPVCQGPTKRVEGTGKERCRNSLCSYNHQDEACPRCQHKGPDVAELKGAAYVYSCPECLNRWTKPA